MPACRARAQFADVGLALTTTVSCFPESAASPGSNVMSPSKCEEQWQEQQTQLALQDANATMPDYAGCRGSFYAVYAVYAALKVATGAADLFLNTGTLVAKPYDWYVRGRRPTG